MLKSLSKRVNHIPTKGMGREEWLKTRNSLVGIGGSDIGTLFALNPWKSAVELFYNKVGYMEPKPIVSEAAFHGTNLEGYIAQLWESYDGSIDSLIKGFSSGTPKKRKCRKVEAILLNPEYPFLFANVDRIITRHPRHGRKLGILEIKTISHRVAEMWEAGVPPAYIYQVHLYVLVCQLKYAELASLKDGQFFDCLPIPISDNILHQIAGRGEDFIGRVIQGREAVSNIHNEEELLHCLSELEPPYSDSPELLYQFYSEKHKLRLSENVIEDPEPEFYLLASEHEKLRNQIDALSKEQMTLKVALQRKMEEYGASVVDFGKDQSGKSLGKITWRKQFRVNFKATEQWS